MKILNFRKSSKLILISPLRIKNSLNFRAKIQSYFDPFKIYWNAEIVKINRSRLLGTSDGLSGLFSLEAIPSGPFGGSVVKKRSTNEESF